MHIQTILDACIHFIFPQSEDALRVEKMTETYVRSLYVEEKVGDIYTLAHFSHPDVRALIHEAKFHQNKRAHMLLGKLVERFLHEHSSSIEFVIPIPLSRRRLRERGYNQVHEILRRGLPGNQFPILTNVLVRKRNTRPQTELERTERLKNMHDAFAVSDENQIAGKRILIVDDVSTTGATLHAAKGALLPYNPASITLLSIAH